MHKYIVTTTINSPTKATRLFCQRNDWKFIIVGDLKTPHEAYRRLEKKYANVLYLSPDNQKKMYGKLSKSIGWKTVERRNVGFVHAYNEGADIIASVDDDNIPYAKWGTKLYVGKMISVDCYEPKNGIFDPLAVTKHNHLWHRGYPIELLKTKNNITRKGVVRRKVLVQADLWDGDPDIDAIARLTFKPMLRFSDIKKPYCSNKISPFNSQNTFLAREVFPHYAVLPFIGRMEDIWGGYILQKYFPKSVIYNVATVYQDRNKQDIIKNLEDEVLGYRNTLRFLRHLEDYEKFLPDATRKFYEVYRKSFRV
jgi:hypothetical protein